MRVFSSILMSIFFCVLSIEASPQAKEDTKILRKQLDTDLKAELEGKVFSNKIVLGGVIKFNERTLKGNIVEDEDGVITEVYPNGRIRYCRYHEPGFLGIYGCISVVDINQLPDKHSIGSRMLVKKVKMKGDSVVLDLSNSYSRTKGWLKFVLGKNYETRYEYESIMILISQALNVDVKRYEQEQEFKDLKGKLQYATTTQARFQIAQQSYELLLEILKQQESSSTVSPRYIQYQQEKTNLETLLQTLRPQAQQERLADIRAILKKETEEENQIKGNLRTKPANLPEMGEQLNCLRRWEELLRHRQQLFQEMTSLGESSSAEEINILEKAFRELDLAKKESTENQSKFAKQELEDEYRLMKQRRLKLYDAYTQVFGSPQEREAKTNLLNHLQRMYENRRSAEQMGSKQAGAEAVKLLEEMRRLQSK